MFITTNSLLYYQRDTNWVSACLLSSLLVPNTIYILYKVLLSSPLSGLPCQLYLPPYFPYFSMLGVIIIQSVCFSPCCMSKCSYSTFSRASPSPTIALRFTFAHVSAFFFSPICSASCHLSSLSSHRVKQAEQIDYKQWARGIEGERQSKFVVDKEWEWRLCSQKASKVGVRLYLPGGKKAEK